jgi:APA family basic amino acid/polyamine antiporter
VSDEARDEPAEAPEQEKPAAAPEEEAAAAAPDQDDRLAAPVPLLRRGLGVPWLFAVTYSAVGFSIYFSIGVVADRGLGLTPLIFLAAGLLFVLTTLTYVEGGAMFLERGGSATFARHAFNELIAFVAGWAILIDYVIVIALAAISVPHYLTPISGDLNDAGFEIAIAAGVIVLISAINILGLTGRGHQRFLIFLALGDLLLQLLVIAVGAVVAMHPGLLTAQLDLFSAPSVKDIVYAAVVATLAFAGIEAVSNLAPDIEIEPRDLGRVLRAGALVVPLVYAGMAAVALMAVPVVAGPHGPHTALAGRFVEEPVLGVVSSYKPDWLSDVMRWTVALVATPVLVWAANTSMLGLSRHIYVLATNRQIPSWLGKLGARRSTPYVAISVSAVMALALVVPTDVKFLAGIYALGATLAITIAHLSVIRLRRIEPDAPRPFRIPFDVSVRGAALPVPAIVGAVVTALAFASVLAFHEGARYVGGGWMVFGLGAYVIYRRGVEKTSLTKRVTVPTEALTKQVRDVEYGTILVPIFGTKLDDDIVSTAGRLASASHEEGEGGPMMDVVYVIEVPLAVALDSQLPRDKLEAARRALKRAREVGEEYKDVEVVTSIIPARSVGSGIVAEARRRNVEAIVMGGEPPTKIRGGAVLGGIGAARPEEVGEATEYVLKKAPCRVLLTAPPEGGD